MMARASITPNTPVTLASKDYLRFLVGVIVWTAGFVYYIERRFGAIELETQANRGRIGGVESQVEVNGGKINKIGEDTTQIKIDMATIKERTSEKVK